MTTDEHLRWATTLALDTLEKDPEGFGPTISLIVLLSALRQHPETDRHPRTPGTLLLIAAGPECAEQVRLHIQGYQPAQPAPHESGGRTSTVS